ALPDLDHRSRHGPSAAVEHAALEMQHRPHGLSRLATHLDEVVVHVGREAHRIERPFGLLRRGSEPCGASALSRYHGEPRAEQQAAAGNGEFGHAPESTGKNGGQMAAVFTFCCEALLSRRGGLLLARLL